MAQATGIREALSDSGVLSDLPTLPTVGLEILRLSRDPDASIEDLGNAISRDPALSVRVVSMANSPAYLRREPVSTVNDAAMVLGRQAISIVALSFSLAQGLERTGSPAGLDLDLLWRRSLTTAAVARHVARTVAKPRTEEAFLAGLLSNLGKMVLAQKMAADYGPIVDAAGGWPNLAEEEAGLGWTSLDITLAVLREWNMAAGLVDAIEHGVDPNRAEGDVGELAPVIGLAIAADASINDSGDPAGHQLVEERFGAMFGSDESVLDGLDDALAEASEMLDIPLPEGISGDDLLAQAREGMLAATLSVATENTHQAQRLEHLERENTELAERATTDGLTDLPNRRSFDDAVAREAGRRNRGKVPGALGIVMLDIDHFKNLNDTYGHAFGDEVLRGVAKAMHSVVRAEETLHRYGGEEFVLLSPSAAPKDLEIVGDRLRAVVEGLEFDFDGQSVQVTISAGGACAEDVIDVDDAQLLIQKADTLLYRAKKRGRNRVEVSQDDTL